MPVKEEDAAVRRLYPLNCRGIFEDCYKLSDSMFYILSYLESFSNAVALGSLAFPGQDCYNCKKMAGGFAFRFFTAPGHACRSGGAESLMGVRPNI